MGYWEVMEVGLNRNTWALGNMSLSCALSMASGSPLSLSYSMLCICGYTVYTSVYAFYVNRYICFICMQVCMYAYACIYVCVCL